MTKNKRWIAGAVLAGLGIFATATPALADRWDYGARSDRREYREYREDMRDLRDAQREYYEDRRNGASRAELARDRAAIERARSEAAESRRELGDNRYGWRDEWRGGDRYGDRYNDRYSWWDRWRWGWWR